MELCRTDGGQELKENFESSNSTALSVDIGDRYSNFLRRQDKILLSPDAAALGRLGQIFGG